MKTATLNVTSALDQYNGVSFEKLPRSYARPKAQGRAQARAPMQRHVRYFFVKLFGNLAIPAQRDIDNLLRQQYKDARFTG